MLCQVPEGVALYSIFIKIFSLSVYSLALLNVKWAVQDVYIRIPNLVAKEYLLCKYVKKKYIQYVYFKIILTAAHTAIKICMYFLPQNIPTLSCDSHYDHNNIYTAYYTHLPKYLNFFYCFSLPEKIWN
jgi:hypothetical protein